jgi:hypothetical protein
MLDCYVYVVFSIVMYVLHFLLLCMCCIFYMPDFGDSLVGEADKIGKKIKKIMFIGKFISSPMYIIYAPRLSEKHKFRYVPQLAKERKVGYVPQF